MIPPADIPPVSAAGGRRATGDETACNEAQSGRVPAQRTTEVGLPLRRGDEMALRSRARPVPAARLAPGRDAFLAGGRQARDKPPREARDRELARRREKRGESTLDTEPWRETMARGEPGRPWRHRRSSRCVRRPRPPRTHAMAGPASGVDGGGAVDGLVAAARTRGAGPPSRTDRPRHRGGTGGPQPHRSAGVALLRRGRAARGGAAALRRGSPVAATGAAADA
jgi:hypothetical protein